MVFLSLFFHFGNNILYFSRSFSLFKGRLKKKQTKKTTLFEEMRPFQEKIYVTKKGDPLKSFIQWRVGED